MSPTQLLAGRCSLWMHSEHQEQSQFNLFLPSLYLSHHNNIYTHLGINGSANWWGPAWSFLLNYTFLNYNLLTQLFAVLNSRHQHNTEENTIVDLTRLAKSLPTIQVSSPTLCVMKRHDISDNRCTPQPLCSWPGQLLKNQGFELKWNWRMRHTPQMLCSCSWTP